MENVSVYLEGTDHLESLDMKAMGARVRKAREDKKLTREKFSEMIDISDVFLGQIERGERSLSIKTLYRIVEFSDSSTDYILFGDKKNDLRIAKKSVKILIKNSDYKILDSW